MGKSIISMAIFNSFLYVYQRVNWRHLHLLTGTDVESVPIQMQTWAIWKRHCAAMSQTNNPSSKWINPTYPIYNSGITHLLSGMNHQVCFHM